MKKTWVAFSLASAVAVLLLVGTGGRGTMRDGVTTSEAPTGFDNVHAFLILGAIDGISDLLRPSLRVAPVTGAILYGTVTTR